MKLTLRVAVALTVCYSVGIVLGAARLVKSAADRIPRV
jgi:hypothetical protein